MVPHNNHNKYSNSHPSPKNLEYDLRPPGLQAVFVAEVPALSLTSGYEKIRDLLAGYSKTIVNIEPD